jgi:hypothetical protein
MVNFRYFYIVSSAQFAVNEVEIYDVSGNNVAGNLGVLVAASSSVSDDFHVSKVLDGNNLNDNQFMSNVSENGEWLEIDLLQEYDISKVRIYNEHNGNPIQLNMSGALLIGCNDKNAMMDESLRIWSKTFDTISEVSLDTRYWDYDVLKLSPTISNFDDIVKSFGEPPFELNPISDSDGVFSYESSNPLVATVSGNNVTILKAGSATITAMQSATIDYFEGTASCVLTVNKAAPSLKVSLIS